MKMPSFADIAELFPATDRSWGLYESDRGVEPNGAVETLIFPIHTVPVYTRLCLYNGARHALLVRGQVEKVVLLLIKGVEALVCVLHEVKVDLGVAGLHDSPVAPEHVRRQCEAVHSVVQRVEEGLGRLLGFQIGQQLRRSLGHVSLEECELLLWARVQLQIQIKAAVLTEMVGKIKRAEVVAAVLVVNDLHAVPSVVVQDVAAQRIVVAEYHVEGKSERLLGDGVCVHGIKEVIAVVVSSRGQHRFEPQKLFMQTREVQFLKRGQFDGIGQLGGERKRLELVHFLQETTYCE